MSQNKISSADIAKITLFLIFLIISWFIFISIIPLGFLLIDMIPLVLLLIGATLSKINQRNDDFITFVKMCKYFYILLVVISFLSSGSSYYYQSSYLDDNIFLLCYLLFQFFLFKFTFEKPIYNNINNLSFFKKGFSVPSLSLPKRNNINILQSNSEIKVEPFSLADELLKWKKMLDEGVISTDEYEKIKNKIIDQ